MENLIQNAKDQFKYLGEVRLTHYFDRSYQNLRNLALNLEDAIALIKEVMSEEGKFKGEDIHCPNSSYF